MPQDFSIRPNRIPWPPLIYLAAVVVALVLDLLWPLPAAGWTPPGWLRPLALALAAAGIALDLAAMATMRRAHTNILPHRGADRLLTDGVFALSRNPIYLGNTLLLAGVGLALPSAWMVAAALVAAWLVDRLAIRREERHLAARFGAAYAAYVARVPRWLRLRR
ncbi:methyltransferase [Cognatiluteimonas weifangensis]|uniref:DUF1295 domain-containing protein n=1 Tax=Cognatiluteimonas weifangensis TaxID=2303539 RepID=A0A372DLE3_9GAMM|nr:methyltransferase [Luteimonas weifangensis]RFP60401.1 DUF1295 domain-containing protein [Luteimonas weifangensis]